MSEFYKNLRQKKLGKLDALREAQLTMLRGYDAAVGQLRGPEFNTPQSLPVGGSSKPASPGPHQPLSPAYWAAFVLSGDWR
jgi:CHAT domain-containing protein